MKSKKLRYIALAIISAFFIAFMPSSLQAQEIETDDDRQALNDELMLLVPEETDNPNHTLSFSNPSTEDGVFLSIDGGKDKEIMNPYTLPSLGIGSHNLSFTFTNAEESEVTYEVSIIVLPRPPQILPPEKSEGGVLISGEATAGANVYLFIAGEKSNYREQVDVSENGKWEYLFLEDYDSSYYTAVAYTSKNGFGSDMSEPIIFTIELDSDEPAEETPPLQQEIVFSYNALLTKEFWVGYQENAEFIIFFATVVFVGIFLGFIISRLIFGGKEKSLEKNLQDALTGNSPKAKENALDRKARREEKKLLKQKEKEERKRKKEEKINEKEDKKDAEKEEKEKPAGSSLLDKFRRSKDKKEEEPKDPAQDAIQEEPEKKPGSRMEPILDEETDNFDAEMQEAPAPDDGEIVREEELNKTSTADVEAAKPKPEVTAMHVPIDDDHDEAFPVYDSEGEEQDKNSGGEESEEEPVQVGSGYEPDRGEGEEQTASEETPIEVEGDTEEVTTETEEAVSEGEGSTQSEEGVSQEQVEEAKDAEEPQQTEADKAKAIDKSDFLNKYKVYDPDPEGKDPLELDTSETVDLETEIKSEDETEDKPSEDPNKDSEEKVSQESQAAEGETPEPSSSSDVTAEETVNEASASEGEASETTEEDTTTEETEVEGSDVNAENTPEQPKKQTMADKLFTAFKQKEETQVPKEEDTNDQTEVEEKTDKLKLEDSNIGTRTTNLLLGEGYTYVEDVKEKSEEELREIKGIGDVAIKEIGKAKAKKNTKGSTKKTTPKAKKKSSKKKSKKKTTRRKKKPVASRKKNNIPAQLTGGLEDVDW